MLNLCSKLALPIIAIVQTLKTQQNALVMVFQFLPRTVSSVELCWIMDGVIWKYAVSKLKIRYSIFCSKPLLYLQQWFASTVAFINRAVHLLNRLVEVQQKKFQNLASKAASVHRARYSMTENVLKLNLALVRFVAGHSSQVKRSPKIVILAIV